MCLKLNSSFSLAVTISKDKIACQSPAERPMETQADTRQNTAQTTTLLTARINDASSGIINQSQGRTYICTMAELGSNFGTQSAVFATLQNFS